MCEIQTETEISEITAGDDSEALDYFRKRIPVLQSNVEVFAFTYRVSSPIFSHLLVVASCHADSFGFMCPGFEFLPLKLKGSLSSVESTFSVSSVDFPE